MSGWMNQLQSLLGQKGSSSGEQGLSKLLVPGALGGLAGLLVANKSSRKLLTKYGTGALEGIEKVVSETIDDMLAQGETPPQALAEK
ncbi:MAG: hypothetical protein E7G69_20075, partial [Enterobacter sp.]|nr:hypothetical protein [Enterobacter sp.]